jgi:hypothetical protein
VFGAIAPTQFGEGGTGGGGVAPNEDDVVLIPEVPPTKIETDGAYAALAARTAAIEGILLDVKG